MGLSINIVTLEKRQSVNKKSPDRYGRGTKNGMGVEPVFTGC